MSSQSFKEELQPKPPQGSVKHAEKYISQLTNLINTDKLTVLHTDLSKYDPSNLQDHYRVELKEYMVEISHSKDANTGRDSFVLLFTNLKDVRDGCSEKLILGYVHLTPDQFSQFRNAATTQDTRLKRQEEERRFNLNLQPIDEALEEIVTGQPSTVETTAQTEASPVTSTPETGAQPTLSSIAQSNPKPEVSPEAASTTAPVSNPAPATTPPAYS